MQHKRKTPLENIEDIEILRFLEMGLKIKLIKLNDKSIAVDTKEDYKKVLKLNLNFFKKCFIIYIISH